MARFLRLLVVMVVIAYVVARFGRNFHRLLTTTTLIGAVSRATEERSNDEPEPNLDMFNGCAMEGDARSPGIRALDRLKNRYTAPSPADMDSAITLAAILAPGNDIRRWKVKE